MKIEHMICTIEQSRILKSLKIKQKSAFYFTSDGEIMAKTTLGYASLGCEQPSGAPDYWDEGDDPDGGESEYCSAFNVAELGIMLPAGYSSGQHPKYIGRWVGWSPIEETIYPVSFQDTEAQLRAAILIDLIERKIIIAKDVNKKLR